MRLLHLLSAVLLSSSLVAHADTLQYTFAPLGVLPTHTFSFELPSNPSPQDLIINTTDQAFAVEDVTAIVDGTPGTFLAVFNFNPVSGGGGFELAAGPYGGNEPTISYFNFSGMPLYSGEPFDPTFLTGSFALEEYGAPYGGAEGLLTVTDLTTAATPEPSGIALLGTGLLGLAGVVRRRVR